MAMNQVQEVCDEVGYKCYHGFLVNNMMQGSVSAEERSPAGATGHLEANQPVGIPVDSVVVEEDLSRGPLQRLWVIRRRQEGAVE
ncbi:hypothetical protein NHX12_008092 [Muraenolepis orangiensis]|uniref:Uncharacterized protein n=1 Tax=Muraenolepis orangiensis TaxID=630683 RepID=A0A9Q0DKN8_9TELE|nr:hypothetical protein NHX12_008092 [Muraenolepis orangiensis]